MSNDETLDPTADLTRNDQMLLIRHIAAKALVESDRIDIEAVPYTVIETALWAAAGEAQHGIHLSDPTEFEDWGEYP